MAGATEQECRDLVKSLSLPGNTSAEIFIWDTDNWAIAFVFGNGAADGFRKDFRKSIPSKWTLKWMDAEYRADVCNVVIESII